MQLNLENDNSAPCQIPESFMLELQNPKKTRPKKPRNISVTSTKDVLENLILSDQMKIISMCVSSNTSQNHSNSLIINIHHLLILTYRVDLKSNLSIPKKANGFKSPSRNSSIPLDIVIPKRKINQFHHCWILVVGNSTIGVICEVEY